MAQNGISTDSTNQKQEVTLEDFLVLVFKNHPVAKQADMIQDNGKWNLIKARGAFDPVLYNVMSSKEYDKKTYYNLVNGGLKIPTWFGLEGKVAFDNSSGDYVNPEHKTPAGGLLVTGVSAPIGKGLFIDERRLQLKQGKAYKKMSEFERFNQLNKLILSASTSYWNWVEKRNTVDVYENGVNILKQRLKNVKRSYAAGAKPAIDTLEVIIQLQNRQYKLNQAILDQREMDLKLSTYMWNEKQEPLELDSNLIAPVLYEADMNATLPLENKVLSDTFDVEQHPMIQSYDYKIKALDYYRKYKAEGLKPKLTVNYNFLTEPVGNQFLNNMSTQNYKWGLEFKFPIFMRKSVAEFKQSKLKLQSVEYDRILKQRNLENKVAFYKAKVNTLEEQERLMSTNSKNYERLVAAEKRKFGIGESSVFLVNYREIKLIEAYLKLVKIRTKNRTSQINLLYWKGQALIGQYKYN